MITKIGSDTIVIRPARPDDAAALAAMFGRCSKQTRYRRFHGFVTEIPAAYLRRCLGDEPPAHRTRVAEVVTAGPAGPLVGLAGSGPVSGAPGVHEAGVLVEDAWQRRGIGRLLVSGL